MQLALYQYKIKYKKGIENVVADALSRLPQDSDIDPDENNDYHDNLIAVIDDLDRYIERDINRTETIDNEQIILEKPSSKNQDIYQARLTEQNKDIDLIWIKNLILENKENKPDVLEFDNYVRRIFNKEYDKIKIHDGILYRETEDDLGFMHLQYILPKQLINDRFFRPWLAKEIIDYIKICDTCQKIKVTGKPWIAPLQPILPKRVNQIVSTDFTGPLTETHSGNKYILLIVDSFSK